MKPDPGHYFRLLTYNIPLRKLHINIPIKFIILTQLGQLCIYLKDVNALYLFNLKGEKQNYPPPPNILFNFPIFHIEEFLTTVCPSCFVDLIYPQQIVEFFMLSRKTFCQSHAAISAREKSLNTQNQFPRGKKFQFKLVNQISRT
jgi:hypothetical protein